MLIAARVHPFPYRTRKLSSLALKILGGKLPGKISRCQHSYKALEIQELCLCADDIWLKYMELLGDVKVFWVPNSYNEAVDVNGSQQISLCSTNNTGRNSRYIKTMNAYFKEIS